MITIISGVPGSGKTYYAVQLIDKLKDKSKVLHNIDGLKVGIPISTFITEHPVFRSTIDLLRRSYHENDSSLHGHTIVIDECQTILPKQFKDTDIISFFDLHRHYGIDIILITQDIKKVCYDISCLAEIQLRAISGASNPLPFTFFYRQELNGESVGRKIKFRSRRIFNLYKSSNDHSSSVSNVGVIYAIIAILGILGFSFGLKHWFSTFRPDKLADRTVQDVRKTSVPKGGTVLASSSSPGSPRPSSISSVLGGNPHPVSYVKDYSGTYVAFAGMLIKLDHFPWPIVKSRLGDMMLLPDDIHLDLISYNRKLDADIQQLPISNESQDSGKKKDNKIIGENGGLSSAFSTPRVAERSQANGD